MHVCVCECACVCVCVYVSYDFHVAGAGHCCWRYLMCVCMCFIRFSRSWRQTCDMPSLEALDVVCMYAYMYVCIHTCMYACLHTYIHMLAYIHTHAYIPGSSADIHSRAFGWCASHHTYHAVVYCRRSHHYTAVREWGADRGYSALVCARAHLAVCAFVHVWSHKEPYRCVCVYVCLCLCLCLCVCVCL
jgi:hypothetical protein